MKQSTKKNEKKKEKKQTNKQNALDTEGGGESVSLRYYDLYQTMVFILFLNSSLRYS